MLTDDDQIAYLAETVLHHIDTMYPRMWAGVSKSARMSLRNTIKIEVKMLISHLRQQQDPESVVNA
jgi:hypothetical protein